MTTTLTEAVLPAIGTSGPVFRGVIERTRLADYARALRLHNPVHYDLTAARAVGFRDIVAPPGFVISHSLQPRSTKLGTFGIEESRALAGELAFDPRGVICAGDELTGCTVLMDLQEKSGKRPMHAYTLETRFTNQLGELVLVFNEVLLQWRA